MCARFSQRLTPRQIAEGFALFHEPDPITRFMVRPRNKSAVIRVDAEGHRVTDWMEWGLIAPGEMNPTHGKRINCRSETAAKLTIFRNAFRERRCLVPMSGYFEWSPAGNKDKQGWYLSLKSGEPIAVPGLWETWTDEDGKPLETFTVLMVEANEFVSEIHPKKRMPAILEREQWLLWLDPSVKEPKTIQPLLVTSDSDRWQRWAVTPKINGNEFDGPEALMPIKPPRLLF